MKEREGNVEKIGMWRLALDWKIQVISVNPFQRQSLIN